jgi:hypothetical protein
MKIMQPPTSGSNKLEPKAQQQEKTKKLEKDAHSDLGKLAKLVGEMKEGTEIFNRKGIHGKWKITSRGLSAGYEHGRAVQSHEAAANLFAKKMKALADEYALSLDSKVREAAAVIHSLLLDRKDGAALKSSGHLAAAIRTIAEAAEETPAASNRQASFKAPPPAAQKEKVAKSADESVHIGPLALEAARKLVAAWPLNGPDTRAEESPSAVAVPRATSSNRPSVVEGFGRILKMARKEVPIPENLPLHQALSLHRLGVDPADFRTKLSPESQVAFDKLAAEFKKKPLGQAR